jgi:hypothetical protein
VKQCIFAAEKQKCAIGATKHNDMKATLERRLVIGLSPTNGDDLLGLRMYMCNMIHHSRLRGDEEMVVPLLCADMLRARKRRGASLVSGPHWDPPNQTVLTQSGLASMSAVHEQLVYADLGLPDDMKRGIRQFCRIKHSTGHPARVHIRMIPNAPSIKPAHGTSAGSSTAMERAAQYRRAIEEELCKEFNLPQFWQVQAVMPVHVCCEVDEAFCG